VKDRLGLGFWILTVVLMTVAIAVEFFRGQRLSLIGFVFVLALALSAIGSSVEEWMGKESAFSRVWYSRAFSVVVLAVTLVLVVLAMALLR
jgi:hypothetical protein